jgi:Zn-finger nucleic acid-binding protein
MIGLHCKNCDWKIDKSLTVKELEQYLNKPCPKCGTILLDKEELLDYAKFQATLDTVNSMQTSEIKQSNDYLDVDSIMNEYYTVKNKNCK